MRLTKKWGTYTSLRTPFFETGHRNRPRYDCRALAHKVRSGMDLLGTGKCGDLVCQKTGILSELSRTRCYPFRLPDEAPVVFSVRHASCQLGVRTAGSCFHSPLNDPVSL